MAAAADPSSPSSTISSIASRIECPVCCEIFRTPKCLSCGHSVCADCCQKLLPLTGTSILCPVCRRSTAVTSTGLSTNFALQDLIQHYQNSDGEKRYRCTECGRSCTADEAWIVDGSSSESTGACAAAASSSSTSAIEPRCFRCIIMAGTETAASGLTPTGMESVTDRIRRQEGELSKLKRRINTFSTEQRDWTNNAQQSTWVMKTRVDDIQQASDQLAKQTLDDVDLLNNELHRVTTQTDSLFVPQSLDGLGAFNQAIASIESQLEQLAEARRRVIIRANVAVNSLAIGLDCLLNAGDDQRNGADGTIADSPASPTPSSAREGDDGFMTPPQERSQDHQLSTAVAAASLNPIVGRQPTAASAIDTVPRYTAPAPPRQPTVGLGGVTLPMAMRPVTIGSSAAPHHQPQAMSSIPTAAMVAAVAVASGAMVSSSGGGGVQPQPNVFSISHAGRGGPHRAVFAVRVRRGRGRGPGQPQPRP